MRLVRVKRKMNAGIYRDILNVNHSVNVLKMQDQSPDLNVIEHLWRDMKMAVHRCSPCNLVEQSSFCKDEWHKLPKDRRAKLVASHS